MDAFVSGDLLQVLLIAALTALRSPSRASAANRFEGHRLRLAGLLV
jgi:hypothetical protein